MANVFKYQSNQDGTYNVIIENVTIPDKNMNMLQLGLGTEVDCRFIDPDGISHKQRKLIFALLNDIEEWNGDPVEYRRHILTQQYIAYKNIESFSLSDCSMTLAREFIEFILMFVFKNDIPIKFKTSDLMKEDKDFIYMCVMKRKCVICGKPHAELAHYHAVGSGRNRRTIDHKDNKILPLCHKHHQLQHNMGMKSFNDYYKLNNSWVQVNDKINRMLKGLE